MGRPLHAFKDVWRRVSATRLFRLTYFSVVMQQLIRRLKLMGEEEVGI
jgi:hypothetical protein